MPSRRKKLTGRAMERRIKDGRGKGHGPEYKPWLYTTDVPSRSPSSVLKGWKHGREHHFLSMMGERRYFFLLEWADCVIDIREQYPMELQDTLSIAKVLGVKHPADHGLPTVMTTDFMLTVLRGSNIVDVARTFKRVSDLNKRTLEKLEIERIYYEYHPTDWGIVTDLDLPESCWRSIEWLHPRRDIRMLDPLTPVQVRQIAAALSEAVSAKHSVLLATLCNAFDQKLTFEAGTCLAVARFLLANKVWHVDLIAHRILPNKPITISVGDLDELWKLIWPTSRCA